MKYDITESSYLKEKCYSAKTAEGLRIKFTPKKLSSGYAAVGTDYGAVDNSFKIEGEEKERVVPDGIAHFLEHKLFESEEGGDAFSLFAANGASANAYTSHTATAYLFSCADNFYENLEILLGMVSAPFFTDQNVEKERGIIKQELLMYRDSPRSRLYYGILGAMYENNPVKREIVGTADSLEKITKEDLYLCYRNFYLPSNLVLSISGDYEFDKIAEIVQKHTFKGESKKPAAVAFSEKAGVFKKSASCKMDVAKSLFAVGIKDTDGIVNSARSMKYEIAMRIMTDILFGPSSAFFKEAYSSNIVNTVSADYECSRAYAHILMSGEATEPEKVFDSFRETVEAAKQNGIAKEDFERAKKVMIAETVRDFDSTEETASEIMHRALEGKDAFEFAQELKDTTIEDVIPLIGERFCEDRYSFYKIIPKGV